MTSSIRSQRYPHPWGFARLSAISASVLAVAAGLVLSLHPAQATAEKTGPTVTASNATPDAKAAASLAKSLSTAFRNAASTIGESVVSIRVEKKATDAPAMMRGGTLPGLPPGFEKFFGEDSPFGSPAPQSRTPRTGRSFSPPVMQGMGSGIITTSDGFIITNAHVVDGADTIVVALPDGHEHPGKVIGVDKDSDLAVVKVDATGLTPATFADSEQVQPGDWCVAAGAPFGLEHTITAGIVSAKGRSGVGAASYEDFIQTDTPINPGNSGGPLVNLDGEVIGINTAIRSASGGSEGIGFAIPAATVQAVMHDLVANGHVDRGWLGVSIQPLTSDLATSMDAKSMKGVLIGNVMPDTPAAKAGLKAGDIVTAINGKPVTEPGQLTSRIARIGPGNSAGLTVMRGGTERSMSVTLGKRPETPTTTGGLAAPEPTNDDRFGLSIQPLDQDLRDQLSLGANEHGLVITDVAPNSPADRAGLKVGDLILSAAGKDIDNAEHFAKLLAKATTEKGIMLRVKRADGARFVVVKPEH